MRLFGYIRVSRVNGREGESFISPDVQREKIEAAARARGFELVDVLTDLDQSGGKLNRPALDRVLAMIEAGEAEGIIVAKLDRFARSLVGALQTIERVQAVGGVILSADGDLDTSSAQGRMIANILLSIAQGELERIRETWNVAGTRAIGRGVHIARIPPIGYARAANGRLVPEPVAAPVIRELFRRRGVGESWTALASFLDVALPRDGGRAWSISTVQDLIKRRTYLGEAHWSGITNPNAHEPIIPRAAWEAAQSVGGAQVKRRDGGKLLAGIARCGACGAALTHNGSHDGWAYRCSPHGSAASRSCTSHVSIRGGRLERFVEGAFLDRLAIVEPIAFEGRSEDDMAEILARLEAAEAEIAAYRDGELVSLLGVDAFRSGLEVRAKAVGAARVELASAQRMSSQPVVTAELCEEWPNMTTVERRSILADVIERVVVLPAPDGAKKNADVSRRVCIEWVGDSRSP
jgi:DNA invertase Pin-like site-specific DNA recombinase